MNSTRANPSATTLAVFGLVLPYAVAILSIVLFKESVRSMDYYTSGKLATWDTVTGWLTFGAFMLGAAFCWPWGRIRFARASSRIGWVTLGVAALAVQFVAVFVVRFLVYLSSGGIL